MKQVSVVLALSLGSASAFLPQSALKRAAAVRAVKEEPWQPGTVDVNCPEPGLNTPEAYKMKMEAARKASGKQDFLEANPYYDQSNIPINTFKAKTPFTGKVVSVKRIVGPRPPAKPATSSLTPTATSPTGRASPLA
jgi:ferredoxin--NADP+ reductase